MRGTLERALVAAVAVSAAAALASASATAAAHKPSPARHVSDEATTLTSPQLWATIDVCKQGEQPIVGVRGSMPTDGHAHDEMYMRFGVQYLDSSTGKWSFLSKGAETSYTEVGDATATRQAGRDFHLASPAAGTSFQMRGVVEFEWRRDGKVVLSATKQTTSGHRATVLHAEPNGFSAATCTVE